MLSIYDKDKEKKNSKIEDLSMLYYFHCDFFRNSDRNVQQQQCVFGWIRSHSIPRQDTFDSNPPSALTHLLGSK
jgi:hypothetical protein